MKTKRISINGKRYIRYYGSADELAEIMTVGDLVTLYGQSEDGSEISKVIGVVNSFFEDCVSVTVAGVERVYFFKRPGITPPAGVLVHAITCVKHPDVMPERPDVMPDGPGLWRDKRGCVWAVEGEHEAAWQIYDENGRMNIRKAGKYANYLTEYAPFTKLTLSEASS